MALFKGTQNLWPKIAPLCFSPPPHQPLWYENQTRFLKKNSTPLFGHACLRIGLNYLSDGAGAGVPQNKPYESLFLFVSFYWKFENQKKSLFPPRPPTLFKQKTPLSPGQITETRESRLFTQNTHLRQPGNTFSSQLLPLRTAYLSKSPKKQM